MNSLQPEPLSGFKLRATKHGIGVSINKELDIVLEIITHARKDS